MVGGRPYGGGRIWAGLWAFPRVFRMGVRKFSAPPPLGGSWADASDGRGSKFSKIVVEIVAYFDPKMRQKIPFLSFSWPKMSQNRSKINDFWEKFAKKSQKAQGLQLSTREKPVLIGHSK